MIAILITWFMFPVNGWIKSVGIEREKERERRLERHLADLYEYQRVQSIELITSIIGCSIIASKWSGTVLSGCGSRLAQGATLCIQVNGPKLNLDKCLPNLSDGSIPPTSSYKYDALIHRKDIIFPAVGCFVIEAEELMVPIASSSIKTKHTLLTVSVDYFDLKNWKNNDSTSTH